METDGWKAPEADPAAETRIATIERELALVDRVLGLEAQVAELAIQSSLTPSDQLRVEQQLAQLRRSATWRVGRIVTSPLRVARRVLTGRGGRR